jgi:hypothetical protein
MVSTLQNRFAAVAGALVLAVALLVLTAGVAQARPSLPQLIRHHSPLVALVFQNGLGGSSTGATVPLVGGRSLAAGHGPLVFQRGRFVPLTLTGSSTGAYVGLSAVLVALAGLAIGLIVSERRARGATLASASGQTVTPMPSGAPTAPAGSEGSPETRRKAA